MHGKTKKLHSAPSGAHSSPKHRVHHLHTATEDVDRSRLVLLAMLLVAQLMVILDITAVNIALPSLARDLNISGNYQADHHELLAHLRQPPPSAAAPPTCSDDAGCS